MSHKSMPAIEILGVAAAQSLHDPGQRHRAGLQKQMHMVQHQNVGVDVKGMCLFQARENLQILRAIPIIVENLLTLIASGDDVI